MTSLSKEGVWADLRYALDELERPTSSSPRGSDGLLGTFGLKVEFGNEIFQEFFASRPPHLAYIRAQSRAEARNAHEAIEKGLKAILLDSGLSVKHTRGLRHELHLLLEDVQQHNPKAFEELERCFDSTIQFLEYVTTIRYNTDIIAYFQEHGREEIFVAQRYESLEGRNDVTFGAIPFIYHELIRALIALIFGRTPRDICSRIEEEANQAVLAESGRDPTWDATAWVGEGLVRPRMEAIERLDNRVLLAAVRRCARESEDRGVRQWAKAIRSNRLGAIRKARVERQAGQN